MKIFSVQHVSVTRKSSTPLELVITASGMASTTGWTNPRLDPAADPVPGDAILEFSFEADRPAGISLQVLTPITATAVVRPTNGADAVVVSARTNSITVHASEFIDPQSSSPAPRPPFTTFAVGEEMFPTTFPTFEESLPTTLMFGEEELPSARFGENNPWTDPRVDDPAVAMPTGLMEGTTGPFPWPGNNPWTGGPGGPFRRSGSAFGTF